jgi:predicted DNA binding protein
MVVYEIEFKIQRNSPQCIVSQHFPDLKITSWCNRDRDVIEISSESEGPEVSQDIKDCIKDLKSQISFKILRRSESDHSVQLVTTCTCLRNTVTTSSLIEKYNCLKMDPILVRRGWAWYRVLAFQQKDIKNLFDHLEEAGLLRIISRRALSTTPVKDTFVISSDSLLGKLTKKQSFAMLAALYQGYYDIPKKVSTEEIAKSLGLPRTTFEEHLRKAESKALKSIMPFLQLSSSPDRGRSNKSQNLEDQVMPKLVA